MLTQDFDNLDWIFYFVTEIRYNLRVTRIKQTFLSTLLVLYLYLRRIFIILIIYFIIAKLFHPVQIILFTKVKNLMHHWKKNICKMRKTFYTFSCWPHRTEKKNKSLSTERLLLLIVARARDSFIFIIYWANSAVTWRCHRHAGRSAGTSWNNASYAWSPHVGSVFGKLLRLDSRLKIISKSSLIELKKARLQATSTLVLCNKKALLKSRYGEIWPVRVASFSDAQGLPDVPTYTNYRWYVTEGGFFCSAKILKTRAW